MRIHPVNYVLASLLSLFCRIAFRARYKIPLTKISQFTFLDPHILASLDPWLLAEEEARSVGQRCLDQIEAGKRLQFRIFGVELSLQKIFQQKVLHEIAEGMQFNLLLTNRKKMGLGSGKIIPSYFHEWAERGYCKSVSSSNSPQMIFKTAITERLWDVLVAVKALAEVFFLLFRRRSALLDGIEIKYVFAGISPGEVPKEEGKLDFRILTIRGLLDKVQALYVLPQGTSKVLVNRMQKDGYLCATRAEIWSSLLWVTRLKLTLKASAFLFSQVLNPFSKVPTLIASDWIRALPWLPFLKERPSITTYLSTVSVAWPEMGEVAAFNAFNKRTVSYHYSCNGYPFSIKGSHFQGLCARFGISSSDEVWVWNDLHADYLRAREVYPGATAKAFRSLGSFMYGEAALLQENSSAIREKFSIPNPEGSLWVSLFDTPTVSRGLRMSSVCGPSDYPVEMLGAFFIDIIEAFSPFARVHFLVKPKRSSEDQGRDLAPVFEEMLSDRHPLREKGRLFVLDHDADPYLGIAAADFSIGLPFSSPVYAAIANKRAGLFYDPLNVVHTYWPRPLSTYLRHGKAELTAIAMKWAADPNKFIEEQSNIDDFSRVTGPINQDPAEVFCNFLEQVN